MKTITAYALISKTEGTLPIKYNLKYIEAIQKEYPDSQIVKLTGEYDDTPKYTNPIPLCDSCNEQYISKSGSKFCDIGVEIDYRSSGKCRHYVSK